jgi:predicted kinase
MKHLQLTPPLLIITMGSPGSGKSYFARQFAEQHGITRISADRIRYELFEQPTFASAEETIIDRVLRYFLEEGMQGEQTIICDGYFLRQKERKELYAKAKQKGYRALTIWLQSDPATALRRATHRDRRETDSQYSFSMLPETFKSIADLLERPHESEEFLVVSGKHAFRSQNLAVLKKIATLYSDSLGGRTQTPEVPRPKISVQSGRRIIQ